MNNADYQLNVKAKKQTKLYDRSKMYPMIKKRRKTENSIEDAAYYSKTPLTEHSSFMINQLY